MKIYKSFLKDKEFNEVKSTLLSTRFPWYKAEILSNQLSNNISNNFQLIHFFYLQDKINSPFYNLIEFFKEKINWLSLIKVKANLLTKTDKCIEHGMHRDLDYKDQNITTGIFYVNKNNGYTKFEDGKIIKSEENKYVEFDTKLKHTGATCTDEDTRIVINFNYIK
jgi:hypothetical protein